MAIFGKPFQPGQSGNPRGRPKMTRQQRIGKLVDAVLREKPKERDGYLAEVLAARLIMLARRGSLKAIELILERTEGKAQQNLNLNTNEQQTVKDVDQRIRDLLRRITEEDDAGTKGGATEPSGEPGKTDRIQ